LGIKKSTWFSICSYWEGLQEVGVKSPTKNKFSKGVAAEKKWPPFHVSNSLGKTNNIAPKQIENITTGGCFF
jgi:hypothetical protein